jgi:hypothetical protein
MIQGGSRAGFALEAFDCLTVPREFLGQKFEGHLPAQRQVFRSVDNSHSPAIELFYSAVMRDGFP